MHNLNLSFFREYNLRQIQDSKEFKIDPANNDRVFFCYRNSVSLVTLSKDTAVEVVNFPCEIIGFEFLSMNNELCIATEDGAVYVYNLTTGTQEEVTYCDDGIIAMQFSWDQETLVVVTK